ncbi:MAG: Asp-tRNA(Asn)/Glu-tRNA(Gln) amidotransferase subunit GatC [Candidatus Obscuribacterales bacterium]
MTTIKDVEHVAKLARLALTEEEKVKFAEQLAKIIDNFNALKEVDTEGVEPLTHALPLYNVLREDKVVTPPGRDLLMKNAPAEENGFFKVPKIGD